MTAPRIAVIGGGPAGSASAITLLQALSGTLPGLQLTLFDTANSGTAAAIGETIPPAATPTLRGLGLLPLLEQGGHLACPGSVSVWGDETPGHNDFFLQPVGHGYHLDRARFDAELRQAAVAMGCELRLNWRLRQVQPLAGGYRLGFTVPSEPEETLIWQEADFVIDASGSGAAFARRLGVARNLFDQVLSVCAFYRLPETVTGRPAHTLVQTSAQGWWYGARLPGQRAIVSLCTDLETLRQDELDSPQAWLDALLFSDWFARECARQFGRPLSLPDRLLLKPAPSTILSAVIGERWLAVGDAASSYDSLSSAGITKALLHAETAGKALAHWLQAGDDSLLAGYQERVFEDFNQYLRLHQRHYRSERRFPHSGFWQRRRVILAG